jgi:hypothetical protein
VLKLEPDVEGKSGQDNDGEIENQEDSGEDEESGSSEEEGTASSTSHETAESPSSQEPELQVGIFCAMGRHRSVAMVEELSRLSWPGWEVRVEHRDISKKRGAGKKAGSRQSRGTRGGTSVFEMDSE